MDVGLPGIFKLFVFILASESEFMRVVVLGSGVVGVRKEIV